MDASEAMEDDNNQSETQNCQDISDPSCSREQNQNETPQSKEYEVVKKDEDPFADPTNILDAFCLSTTLHGIAYWHNATSTLAKCLWALVTFCGVAFSAHFIYDANQGWQNDPTVTFVKTIPIQKIQFPAITICPMDQTRFPFVESEIEKYWRDHIDFANNTNLNQKGKHQLIDEVLVKNKELKVVEIVREILTKQFSDIKTTKNVTYSDPSDCLIDVCESLFKENEDFVTILQKKFAIKRKVKIIRHNAFGQVISEKGEVTDDSIEEEDCPEFPRFVTFVNKQRDCVNYGACPDLYLNETANKDEAERDSYGSIQTANTIEGNVTECNSLINEFRFFLLAENLNLVSPTFEKSCHPIEAVTRSFGNTSSLERKRLLKMMFSQIEPDLARLTFSEKNDGLYCNLTRSLQSLLSRSHTIEMLAKSIQPPHVLSNSNFEEENVNHKRGDKRKSPKITTVSNGAFPFCGFKDVWSNGILESNYNEVYCNSFQTTFNEHGMCYTFNNYPQRYSRYLRHKPDKTENGPSPNSDEFTTTSQTTSKKSIKNVKGCGNKSGFQLIIDSQRLTSLLPTHDKSKGYQIHITVPGVTSSEVPYTIEPGQKGEHKFVIHGIHKITATEEFKDWNKVNKDCYYPDGKNLTYFQYYNKDNCRMECRLRAMLGKCGCLPWYIPRKSSDDTPFCNRQDQKCINVFLSTNINETELCKECKNDCEMTHFWTAYELEPELSDKDRLFNNKTSKGMMAQYLLDPKRIFTDDLTRNISKFHSRQLSDISFAEERLENDILVLNFYFDTPFITVLEKTPKVSDWDKISAVGSILGVFTGFSFVTGLEFAWWLWILLSAISTHYIFNGIKMCLRKNLICPSTFRRFSLPEDLEEIILSRESQDEIWGLLVEGETDKENKSMPSKHQFLPAISILDIKPDSAASKAGLKPGNEIWKIQGTNVLELSYAEFIEKVESTVGNELKISINRIELESVFVKNDETRQKSPKTSVLRRSSTEPLLTNALNQETLDRLPSQERKPWHGSTNM